MYKFILYGLFLLGYGQIVAQELYFPPAFGNWATTDPAELDWCDENLADLQDFLGERDSKAFIILKEGRIVVEWYYGEFTQDSVWYWASAGKSLLATMIGMAQEEGLLDINDATQDYLGEGWTSLSPEQEATITIRHQLTMTTGLDDGTGDVDCTTPDCLQYLAEPGTRWAYHNAPYTLLGEVLEAASGLTPTQFFNNRIGSNIGALGAFIPLGNNRTFFSTPRNMARFGHLVLANGQWGNIPVFSDEDYLLAMATPSQDLNLSYGYLWWLNGQTSYMYPSLQLTFDGPLIPTAPADLYAGLGKNDQKVYVIPSQNMVVVRMGNDASDAPLAISDFDVLLWEKISNLACVTSTTQAADASSQLVISPNPASDQLSIDSSVSIQRSRVFDLQGRFIQAADATSVDTRRLPAGTYYLHVLFVDGQTAHRRFIVSR